MPAQEEERKQGAEQPYLYTNSQFPCLVKYGGAPEDLLSDSDLDNYYHVNARNVLRSLTYGAPLFKGPLSWPLLKLAWLYFKTLMLKRDPNLLRIIREEMKFIFTRALEVAPYCDPEAEQRLEIFIDSTLSFFPFMDPEEGETLIVPQKINNKWCSITYLFKKIDLSPKTGWYAKYLEEEDHLYAYGLEPQLAEASPHLLLMGTTYLSGQGSNLSLLGDVTAGLSVGERHDLTELEQWIRQHPRLKISGASQGATMALIVGAKYAAYVLRVISLNPAALLETTLDKLMRIWAAQEIKPECRVFTQAGDPVLIFGEGFLPGTRFTCVSHAEINTDSLFAVHAKNYLGYFAAQYEDVSSSELELGSEKRKFFNFLKGMADNVAGPLLNLNIVYSLFCRKMLRFFSPEDEWLRLFLFCMCFLSCFYLLQLGLIIPANQVLALSSLNSFSPLLYYSFLVLISLGVTSMAPKGIQVAIAFPQLLIGVPIVCTIILTLSASSFAFGGMAVFKRGERKLLTETLFRSSTGFSLKRLGV
ncbi:MAG TPA: hypothetical protein VLH77_01670, partial [Gammaproteobacteria bacterium]|nr:hypothetical protein [Gammaproteobacteria bacterium]